MKKKIFIIIFLILVSLVAFGRIVTNDFINFDDKVYITDNEYIKSGINPERIKWALSTFVASNWHPLTWISHMLDWSLFGINASGHHLVSLLLHIGSVVLLFLFLNKTTNNLWPSAFAAALFAIHPLRVESVAWAAERKDVLSMFFGMASIYAYSFYSEKSKPSLYLLCLMLFVLALMAKPMMVTLPFVLLLLDYWPLKRWGKIMVGKLIGEKIPFIFLTIGSSILTFWAQNQEGAVASVNILPFFTQEVGFIIPYVSYLEKIFWPINLSVFYPYVNYVSFWKILVSGIILIMITSIVLYYIRNLPFLFVGWFWYLGTLVPVIGLVKFGNQAIADRYTYLPSIGITIILAWGVPFLLAREDIRKKILLPAGIVILTILAILTWQQCGYWKNSTTLFQHALLATDNNDLAHNNFACSLAEEGKLDEAIHQSSEAIRINPVYTTAYYNRGIFYSKLGRYKNAIDDFSKAIHLRPDYAESYDKRGVVYAYMGLYKLAFEDLDKAIRLKPHQSDFYFDRGTIYAHLGRYQQAIEDYNQAIRLKPDYAEAYDNRGAVYLNQGNKDFACSDALKACKLGKCATLQSVKGLCR